MLANLPPIHKYLPLIIGQNIGRQKLERVPEPSAITNDTNHVLQYDQVMTTKLAIAYMIGIEQIYRCRPEPFGGTAIDLACGPGHMSLCMAKHLKLDQLIGVDLSKPMVEIANKNAVESGIEAATFRVGDVTDLKEIPDQSCDLSTFCDAAHHMPDLQTVGRVIREMDRITKPDGLIFIMDLARLRTDQITEQYVRLVGDDYIVRGLKCFYNDFRNSMFAAWTMDELRTAVPLGTARSWYHLSPLALPSLQFIIGVGVGSESLPQRLGLPWDLQSMPLCEGLKHECQMVRLTLRGVRHQCLTTNLTQFK